MKDNKYLNFEQYLIKNHLKKSKNYPICKSLSISHIESDTTNIKSDITLPVICTNNINKNQIINYVNSEKNILQYNNNKSSNFKLINNKKKYNIIELSPPSKRNDSKEIISREKDIEYCKTLLKKYSPMFSKKIIFSRELTDNTKELYKKNVALYIMKKKIEEMKEKEKNKNLKLKQYTKQLDYDFNNFNSFLDSYKTNIKNNENIINYHNNKRSYIDMELNEENIINKKLNDFIEKTIKDIYSLKDIGSFIYKINNLPFFFDNLPEINIEEKNNLNYDFELLGEKIIKMYEDYNKNNNIINYSILNDNDIFYQNYILYEKKILNLLNENNNLRKEELYEINNNNYLGILSDKINTYQKEEKSIIKQNNIFNKYHQQVIDAFNLNESKNNLTNYIFEIGKILGAIPPKVTEKEYEYDYNNYYKEIVNNIKEKEKCVNEHINNIEKIINSRNPRDRKIIESILLERKKEYQYRKQLIIKEKMKKIENNKKIKAYNKSQKYIIKKRNLNLHYFNRNNKKLKKIINKENNNDIDLLYYSQ